MYKYWNPNPLSRLTSDCVIRATATALNKTWYEASDLLYAQAKKCCCEMSTVGSYGSLFDNELKFSRIEDDNIIKVKDVGEAYPLGILLVRIRGHLTCVKDGLVWDIWDCSGEDVDIVWRVR